MPSPSRSARGAHPRRHDRRRGYVLVFMAMMLFGILAMAGLVIDIGFARLTQRQMQVAAESGAIEGLRGDGVLAYTDRREAAREVVHWHFDDDLDSTGVYPTDDDGAFGGGGHFGAGPIVQFSGGAGDPSLVASQRMQVDQSNSVYKPEVLDGSPSAPGTFQVALRRGAIDAPVADLYADGPAVPYLFARGSLLGRWLIEAGITVRGTGRAGLSNALSIGLANGVSTPPLPGLLPVAFEMSYWNGLNTGTASAEAVAAGEIALGGRFFSIGATETMPLSIGRRLPSAAIPADGAYEGYVPIYSVLAGGGPERVVGFGMALVVVGDGGTSASVTRLPSRVGAENVSPVRCHSVNLSAVETTGVFSLLSQVEEPLLAPSSTSAQP